MINKLDCYQCDYCKSVYKTKEEASNCFNTHSIVFVIEEYGESHDCWGAPDGWWKETEVVFKDYEKAEKFVGSNGYKRIKYKKLCD